MPLAERLNTIVAATMALCGVLALAMTAWLS